MLTASVEESSRRRKTLCECDFAVDRSLSSAIMLQKANEHRSVKLAMADRLRK